MIAARAVSRPVYILLWAGPIFITGMLFWLARMRYVVVHDEAQLRRAVTRADSKIVISGDLEIRSPIEISTNGIELRGGRLRMAADFAGSGAIVARRAHDLRIAEMAILGNRAAMASGIGLPPFEQAFADYYRDNGIVVRDCSRVRIERVTLERIRSFAILINGGKEIVIERAAVRDSGTLDTKGQNNTTGGILIEEGASDFVVRDSIIERVPGNGIWTHSRMESPRNRSGIFTRNTITEVARDALQAGHATEVRIENNRGARIGFPVEQIDMDAQAVPVAIDTAGNVDRSVYSGNTFEDVNGKCVDLDGFHDGEVTRNSCRNSKPPENYPHSQFAISFNNSNPHMESNRVLVSENVMHGFAYGGVFLIGSMHRIVNNRFLNVNRANCTGDVSKPKCNYAPDQPDYLRSGIYLTAQAHRPATTTGNEIAGNVIEGFGMEKWCIAAAPGVSLAGNRIEGNTCRASQ
jgi:hypothetical protein